MYYSEASGKDLFEIVKNPENTKILRLLDNGRVVEFIFLAVFQYNKNIEKATYVVVKIPDENNVDVAQIIRLNDGRSAFLIDIDNDIKMRVYEDFQNMVEDDGDNKPSETASTTSTQTASTQTASTQTASTLTATVNKKQTSKITRLPKLSWYAENGFPIEQIPIDKQILKKELSEEEKSLVAVTTYPIVVRNSFITLGLTVVLIIAAAICFAGVGGIEGAIVFMAIFVIGSFLINKFGGIFDGFDIIGGTWRIKMPIGYHILYRLTAPIAMLWGALSAFICGCFLKRYEKFRMLLLPRIAMPKGCGLDDIIYVYKKYEADVDRMDAIAQQMEQEAKQREILQQKSKVAMDAAKSNKTKMEKQNKTDYSYHRAYEINQIDKNVEQLKKVQKEYETKYQKNKSKLQSEHLSLKYSHKDDVNSLKGR